MDENLYNASYYMYQNPGWPISDPDWAIYPPSNDVLFNYAITYLKGACVLYMYHQMVGDSLFYQSIYDYANDTVNFRYQSATIPDFIVKMNEATEQDMSWFFEQWLYTPNHPIYSNTYSIHQRPNDQWEVKLNIKQTQTNTGFFTMPVEIKVEFAIGDTLINILNDANDQNFSFMFDKRPTMLQFDPNNKIILKNSTTVVDSKYINEPKPQEIQIKGNPSEGNINVFFNTSVLCKANIFVHSGTGVMVYEKRDLTLNPGESRIPINLSYLANGTYILTLVTEDNKLTEKIMIVK
jgi:aminopeptidase N